MSGAPFFEWPACAHSKDVTSCGRCESKCRERGCRCAPSASEPEEPVTPGQLSAELVDNGDAPYIRIRIKAAEEDGSGRWIKLTRADAMALSGVLSSQAEEINRRRIARESAPLLAEWEAADAERRRELFAKLTRIGLGLDRR